MIEFNQARDNLACTIYVPWDCYNNCEFCTSKKMYTECKKYSFSKMNMMFDKINKSPIQEIVITGGEPSYDISKLRRMVKSFPQKNVYINTTLPKTMAIEFIHMVNDLKNIIGVNISRHTKLIEEEKLKGIVDDLYIGYIKCPIHINVVSPEISNIPYIVDRYKGISRLRQACGFGSINICIREDYRKTQYENLHDCNNEFFTLMDELNYEFISHNQCNVCDTNTFKVENGLFISYHKGLEYTSIKRPDGTIEVNDIVMFPDGKICYDWDRDKDFGTEIFDNMKFKVNPINVLLPKPANLFPPYVIPPCGCDMNVNHDYKGCGTGGC